MSHTEHKIVTLEILTRFAMVVVVFVVLFGWLAYFDHQYEERCEAKGGSVGRIDNQRVCIRSATIINMDDK